MSRRTKQRSHPALALGILVGFALTIACMADQATVWAKDVLFKTPISGLAAPNLQQALATLVAGWAGRPLDRPSFEAAVGKRSDKNPLSHSRYSDADARAEAVRAWGKASDPDAAHHNRYDENDLEASSTLAALQKAIKSTAAEVRALEALAGDAACPPGYSQVGSGKTPPVVCKRGSDEMVRIGDFWIDRYEITIVNSKYFDGGKCDNPNNSGKRYGYKGPITQNHDDYPAGFPASGQWTTPLWACSISGVQPSRSMSWFRGAQACAAAGKRLCTDLEWQVAATGSPEDATSCTTDSGSSTLTGAKTKCKSSWGAYDMVGNLWEFDTAWNTGGERWMTAANVSAQPWPKNFGDGKDVTWNVNGTVLHTIKGRPTMVMRSGSWINQTAAGPYATNLKLGPVIDSELIGTRCCI